jgi:hypothetical protein
VEGYEERLTPWERAGLAEALAVSIVGDHETVRQGLAALVTRTGADELMVTTQMHDHRARLRSFEITAEVRAALAAEGAPAPFGEGYGSDPFAALAPAGPPLVDLARAGAAVLPRGEGER